MYNFALFALLFLQVSEQLDSPHDDSARYLSPENHSTLYCIHHV
uniref:Uncharacterized protein n=1 Tax=Setaria viridis TaxID=4556 RepID=A0A4U6UXT7_SETVI|nr:hypothetical protein SEVIR_4G107901v2 [Setaria viridis]